MAKYSRVAVLNTMIKTGLIPVFYHGDIDIAIRAISACLEGGVRCVEFTNRGDQAHLVFGELVRKFEGDHRLILGAGSIIDPGAASLYIQLGANFIVGPVLNTEVARVCNRRKVAYSPGCASLSEISQAEQLGVEICKIFPGKQVGGPSFIKAVSAPMPWVRIMPTGGVQATEESIRSWFDAGAACVGMGSKLITKSAMENGDFESVTEKTKDVLGWIADSRLEHPVQVRDL